MARCKSCSAEIEWTTSVKGNSLPLDAEPVADGNIVLRHGEAHVLNAEQLAALPKDVPRFKAHFATCPHSAMHRRKD